MTCKNRTNWLFTPFLFAAVFAVVAIFLTGCPGEPEPPEPAEPAPVEPLEEPEAAAPVVPEVGEPEQVDIKDPSRAPDTVLATVDGEHIYLQDLYDEFAGYPLHSQQAMQHEQHRLLEHMIQERLLLQKAKAAEMEDTGLYRETLEAFKASPKAGELGEAELRKIALVQSLLEKEVVEKVQIPEEELEALFNQYRQMIPEDLDFEDVKPDLESMLMQEHIFDYIRALSGDAEVEIDEAWMEEKIGDSQTVVPRFE